MYAVRGLAVLMPETFLVRRSGQGKAIAAKPDVRFVADHHPTYIAVERRGVPAVID